ncbi:PAS domain-containing protein [Desulfosporosinus acidiphilus]|uniref:PAS domain-containing protein n=1 Tax=Desulfosporosinus acidiphilus TaxID=885581 RepID=UPI0009FCD26F
MGTWEVDLINNTGCHDSRWKAILGYSEHEVIDDWHRLIHPEDVKKVDKAIQETVNRKSERYSSEYRLLHKNGTYRWVEFSCSIIYDQSLQPLRLLGLTIAQRSC